MLIRCKYLCLERALCAWLHPKNYSAQKKNPIFLVLWGALFLTSIGDIQTFQGNMEQIISPMFLSQVKTAALSC